MITVCFCVNNKPSIRNMSLVITILRIGIGRKIFEENGNKRTTEIAILMSLNQYFQWCSILDQTNEGKDSRKKRRFFPEIRSLSERPL